MSRTKNTSVAATIRFAPPRGVRRPALDAIIASSNVAATTPAAATNVPARQIQARDMKEPRGKASAARSRKIIHPRSGPFRNRSRATMYMTSCITIITAEIGVRNWSCTTARRLASASVGLVGAAKDTGRPAPNLVSSRPRNIAISAVRSGIHMSPGLRVEVDVRSMRGIPGPDRITGRNWPLNCGPPGVVGAMTTTRVDSRSTSLSRAATRRPARLSPAARI